MKVRVSSIVAFGVFAAFSASPAFAGVVPVPEPEVAAGLVALAAIGVGYRLLKRRVGR